MRPQDEQAHPEVVRTARAQIPRSYLLYGYTTLVDLSSTPQRMAEWNTNEAHPDTHFCGGTRVIDGYGMALALEAGADIIAHGMWHWDVPPSAPTATSKPGTVTPGVKKILDKVIEGKVGWQPTMQVLYGLRDLFDPDYLANPAIARVLPASLIEWYRTPEGQWFRDIIAADIPRSAGASAEATWEAARPIYAPYLANGANAASYLITRNANILFGTDTPSSPRYANPPGINGFLEMHRLVEAGMTPAQVFRAATLTNAEMLRLGRDIGTVEVGKRANLLLMRDDPTQSVDAYAGIVKVVVGGRVLDTADLAADRLTQP